MERYILIDHTADMVVKAFGKTLEECYANAAYALFDQTVDLSDIGTSEETEIRVTGIDDEDRLYSFLSELLFIMDTESVVFNWFEVTFDGDKVRCVCKGENLDVKKHHAKAEIKAVTYHMLSVDRKEPAVTVIFDV